VAAADASLRLRPGDTLDSDLTVVRAVASGGMGDVYLAQDAGLGRQVAVKLLRPSVHVDATAPTLRAAHEGRAAARVVHPHAAAIFRRGRAHGRPMLVGEWVEGPTLRVRLADGPLPAAEAAAIFGQIAGCIAYAHAQGLAHCDLKPENVLVARGADGGPHAKVIDFGLARGGALPLGDEAIRHGTRAYLPPEAFDPALGRLEGVAVDAWALAVLGCELFGYARPIEAEGGQRALPSALPRRLAEVFARALEPTPTRRLRDVHALAAAVTAALQAPTAATVMPSVAASRLSVQAAFALLERPGRGLLGAALGPGGLEDYDALGRAGWLEADGRPASTALATLAAEQLGAAGLRAVASALADARLARPARGGGTDEALGLLLHAGRLRDAAALIAEDARARPSLRERRQGLQRALSLSEADAADPARIAMLLERAELAVSAGWPDVAREDALAARELLSGSAPRLLEAAPPHERARWSARASLVLAELSLAAGDTETAQRRLDALADAPDELGLSACAGALRAAAEGTGDAVDVEGRLAALLARLASAAGLSAALRARIERARAAAAMALGVEASARSALRRAAAAALEAGAAHEAAECLVDEAALVLGPRPDEARAIAAEAAALLDGQGVLRATLRLDLVEVALARQAGELLTAMRRASVALSRAEALGGVTEITQAAEALRTICAALGDEAGVWFADQRLRRPHRAAGGDGSRRALRS
jgi:hypothetical protein